VIVLHYHGTPITPASVMVELAGHCFCVSHADPRQVEVCHRIGQSVMLDNGAFSAWRRGHVPDWAAYYEWCGPWLDCPTTWAVIPDVIGGGAADNDRLISEWPHGEEGSPVWHLDEPIARLLRLLDEWPRVCFGSSGAYSIVGSPAWHDRVSNAWDQIALRHQRTPWVHMLRGLSQCGGPYPFASADSTDIARNHAGSNRRSAKSPKAMAIRWDARQCPSRWTITDMGQMEIAL
jgi:hypothetical protein